MHPASEAQDALEFVLQLGSVLIAADEPVQLVEESIQTVAAQSLIGVTRNYAGANASTDFLTALFSIVSIALGVVIGAAIDPATGRWLARL